MKVYFAGNRENCGIGLLSSGVRYRLESFYDFRIRKAFDGVETWNKFNHVIFDSGLFTLMFGNKKDEGITEKSITQWQKHYINFINNTPFKNASFVECDVQKKIGVEMAWKLRRELKKKTNKGTIINVYHLEDENPDKLIKYSDYIAISIPELRFNLSTKERYKLTKYISRKAKRLNKKVHLLGCTETKYLKDFSYCDTCDSTSWQQSFRYGNSKTKNYGQVHIKTIRANNKEIETPQNKALNDVYWASLFALADYKQLAGNQK